MITTKKYFDKKQLLIKSIRCKIGNLFHNENDAPAYIDFDRSGDMIEQRWYTYGRKNRNFDRPAVIKYEADDNKQTMSNAWYVHGKLHRLNDKPAIEIYFNDVIVQQEWYVDDNRQRYGDKPSVKYYYNNGIIKQEEYRTYDTYDRQNGNPSMIAYFDNGDIKSKGWYLYDELFRRDNLPVFEEYWENGNYKTKSWGYVKQNYRENDLPCSEIFYDNGNIHIQKWNNRLGLVNAEWLNRDNDLPAFIEYDIGGSVIKKIWYINGKKRRINVNDPIEVEYNGEEIISQIFYIPPPQQPIPVRIPKVNNKIVIIKEVITTDECVVCRENVVDKMIKTKCNHLFCQPCFTRCVENNINCAYCRQKLN